jgi:sugar O-acyltransferase (sialic acid O-acetyltransferase NeuD family)
MIKKVVVFGLKDLAELAKYYLAEDSPYELVAFTVHRKYIEADRYLDLPVIAFEDLEKKYPPYEFGLFAPMFISRMNKPRESVYLEGKKKGYKFISYISSRATVLSEEIGDNCFILEDNTIQPFVKIGNNVVLWSGNHIGHHGIIEDHVFIASHVVVSGHCRIGRNSFLGVNATIRNHLTLAEGTYVGMATAIVRDTEPWSVYVGNPAKKLDVSSLDFPI